MRRITLLLIALLTLAPRAGAISRYYDIDWERALSDSVPAYWGNSFQLDGYSANRDYTAQIEYPDFQEIPVVWAKQWKLEDLQIPAWPEISSSVGFSAGEAWMDVSFLPVVKRGGKYFRINSFKLVVKETLQAAGRKGVASAVQASERYTYHSVLESGNWVKIRVEESGVYKLTPSFLKKAGFADPGKVRLYGYGGAVLPETNLQDLPDDLFEIPLVRTEQGLLFYASGPVSWSLSSSGVFVHKNNTYSRYAYYFLTASDTVKPIDFKEAGLSGTAQVEPLTSFSEVQLYEKEQYSWLNSGREFFDGYDYSASGVCSYSMKLAGMADSTATLTVRFSAAGTSQSSVGVAVNGNDMGKFILSKASQYQRASVAIRSFICANAFQNGDNSITLKHTVTSGQSGRLDYMELNYQRELRLNEPSLCFRFSNEYAGQRIKIETDARDAVVLRRLADGQLEKLDAAYSDGCLLTGPVEVNAQQEYVAINPAGTFPEPVLVGQVANQNLHGLADLDMVIIVPASGRLTAQAERLAEWHRTSDGLSVCVTRADMIYNEFSSGTPDATAYRRFMKMLYDRSEADSKPKYLLLFGAGVWDNRMVTSDFRGCNPDDYLLCYESQNSVSEVQSYVLEDYFGFLDDSEGNNYLTEKVDLGVGRLPILTESQGRAMVNKIIAYASGKYAGNWQNRILLLGDDGDNNLHMSGAEEVAQIWQTNYKFLTLRKIYWDNYKMELNASGNSYPSVRKLLLEEFSKGALIVNYVGHASNTVISHELVLSKSDMSALDSPMLPFWITSSCDVSPFDDGAESIGVNLISNETGGAIGLLSTTRTVYSNSNIKINRLFADYVLGKDKSGERYTVGDALRLSKVQLVSTAGGTQDLSENKLHYVLLGDPALKLGMAESVAVVDSFNDKAVSESDPQTFRAGEVIKVTGHIEDIYGNAQTGFNGMLHATILDNERKITTLNNSGEADKPFEYYDRDRIVYSGTDSVCRGEFSFMFPVPLDINYSGESGRINLYALSADDATHSANGYSDAFLLGGTYQELENDSCGPTISLYLNDPDFQYGGNVNITPCLIADLKDSDGINASGNGIGHDIMLIIDNNPLYTYNLNGYYTSAAGSYSQGRVVFSIPELPEGKHTLLLRAWDVLNNSGTKTLAFNVVAGLKPKVTVRALQNPAHGQTTIAVSHDRSSGGVQVTLQVLDLTGRIVWSTRTTHASDNGVCLTDWNLNATGGARLSSGVYMLRAVVTDAQGNENVASDKLIIR